VHSTNLLKSRVQTKHDIVRLMLCELYY